MSLIKDREFSAGTSVHRKRQMNALTQEKGSLGPALTTLYLGISAVYANDDSVIVALAIRDVVHLIDFSVKCLSLHNISDVGRDPIADHVIEAVEAYEHNNYAKFIIAGLSNTIVSMSPSLCSHLWLELDIIPIVIRKGSESDREGSGRRNFWEAKQVDEQADSMARKGITYLNPSSVPLLQVGWRGVVQVDAGFQAKLVTAQNYKKTCTGASWETLLFYVKKLQETKTKIAFFSSTPQGGGVALMRHALVRFSRLMSVDLSWYVPKPQPGVFQVTKRMHNILQGVTHPERGISTEDQTNVIDWITNNANRYWLSEGGPLRPPEEGGADIVIIDDPQMIGLIPLIKKVTPNRPVIYRSHIQIRSDLIAMTGSPQSHIWDFLWANIKEADLYISHPVPSFVPHNVPREKVVYMPATSDWLDGLNKKLNNWDTGYYRHIYNIQCHMQRMTPLRWPAQKYIAQVARFDPAKGIPTVIDSYAEFRRQLHMKGIVEAPQLVICGNGSVDDPGACAVFDQTMNQLETKYPHLVSDVSVMRLEPRDQVLNCILANAHVVLQLSTSEGFEVKVSEALHAGRPVIATVAGGIPLQIKDGVNGFLVQPDDSKAVAGHLMDLFTDDELHKKMCCAAKTSFSDEVSTVGNAIGWYYLAFKAVNDRAGLKGNEQWVNDLAREEAGRPYTEQENRLPRHLAQ